MHRQVYRTFGPIFRRHRWLSSGVSDVEEDLNRIRNIGIIAHIDAGKTTTTERMLFYSGFIPSMGEVHDGDTITDFMPQERERGITITSATITFPWNDHTINLIDTPGHVDFTVEVERSLRVLDGAVTILDSSAGVEAQTLTVWRQADRYALPRMIYLNKMDKARADFDACIEDIEKKLEFKPLVCQFPVINPKDKSFCGVFDLIRMRELIWDAGDGSRGAEFRTIPFENSVLKDKARGGRERLIEALADCDDEFAEKFVLSDVVPEAKDIERSIRKSVATSSAVPLFCGSSYKNIGIQPLLDSIVKFLPNPSYRVPAELTKYFDKDDTVGLAFKILHTKKKGPLTFVRIYQGDFSKGQRVHIMNRDVTEKCGDIFLANADEYLPIRTATRGNIIAMSDLKQTVTGDTVVGSAAQASKAKNKANRADSSALLFGIEAMEPVFQCNIESPSAREQAKLDAALECLQREDPSIRVTSNVETGQTVLSGMGKLHIDVVTDRIRREYGVEPFVGPLEIAYRETLIGSLENVSFTLDKTIGGSKQFVDLRVDLTAAPAGGKKTGSIVAFKLQDGEIVERIPRPTLRALAYGAEMSLSHGPLLGFPLKGVQIVVRHFETKNSTSLPMVTAAASQCIQKGLRAAAEQQQIELLEPTVRLEISTPDEHVGKIIADLAKRRAVISSLAQRGKNRIIYAHCPLSGLQDYSTVLRTASSGRATFIMEVDEYKMMTAAERNEVFQRLSGVSFQ